MFFSTSIKRTESQLVKTLSFIILYGYLHQGTQRKSSLCPCRTRGKSDCMISPLALMDRLSKRTKSQLVKLFSSLYCTDMFTYRNTTQNLPKAPAEQEATAIAMLFIHAQSAYTGNKQTSIQWMLTEMVIVLFLCTHEEKLFTSHIMIKRTDTLEAQSCFLV